MLIVFGSIVLVQWIRRFENSTDLSVSGQVVEESSDSPFHSAGCDKARQHPAARGGDVVRGCCETLLLVPLLVVACM